VAKIIPNAARARSPRIGSRGARARTFSRRKLIEMKARPLAPHSTLTRATSSIASARCLWDWARPSISRTPYGEKGSRERTTLYLLRLPFGGRTLSSLAGSTSSTAAGLAMISRPRIARALL
jgi:hypothetical protein